MAGNKYSIQRESIKKYLNSTTSHPTADTVYLNVKGTLPNISLGTVYRNLNLLAKKGDILKLDCGDGCERFDGNPQQHYHFLCTECHSVIDLEMDSIDHINTLAGTHFDGEIVGHKIYFYGKCEKCKNK